MNLRMSGSPFFEDFSDNEVLRSANTTINEELTAFEVVAVSYTHVRAHETVLDLVYRLPFQKK